jgi:hypothetical protein
LNPINFEVRYVPAGTGSAVWDEPFAKRVVERFMAKDRRHGPMIGIIDLGQVRPSSVVLRDLIVPVGEDARAGRYGNFSFVVFSEDDATRCVISDIASAQDFAIFVGSSPTEFRQAEAVGDLTTKDQETLSLVFQVGGTVTASQLADRLGVEQTTAGNRLIALNKKGYLQRLERPHPEGDQFIDPRSVRLTPQVLTVK